MDLRSVKKFLPHVFLTIFFVYETVLNYRKFCYITDLSREIFYPLSVLNGEVLYKDIFNIFGPFSYYFNALLYKIFGINLSTLYFAGVANTAIILVFTYLIAKKFLPKKISFSIVFFTTICAFSPTIMNYIIPYSYSIVYGYSAFLISVYLFLQYLEKDKNIFLYTSALFAGVSITCKYEFMFYPLVMFVFLWIKKHKEHKNYGVRDFLPLATFFIFPLIFFTLPFLQGLALDEFFRYLNLLFEYSKSPSLLYLYNSNYIFLMIGLVFLAMLCGVEKTTSNLLKKDNKVIKYFLSIVFLIIYFLSIINVKFSEDCIRCLSACFPVLILCLLIYSLRKKLNFNISENFVICSTIVSIFKFFLSFIIIYGYGNYFIGILLITTFFLYLKVKNINNTSIKFITVVVCMFFCLLFVRFHRMTLPVQMIENKTARGQYITTDYGLDAVIKYIKQGTSKNDKVIVLPEGAIVNFITDRKSDNYYNIFTPDRVEAYGQQDIINHYTQKPPEYFVINNQNKKAYGKGSFCDYANDVCIWISQNYNPVYQTFPTDEKAKIYTILKRK